MSKPLTPAQIAKCFDYEIDLLKNAYDSGADDYIQAVTNRLSMFILGYSEHISEVLNDAAKNNLSQD